MSEELHIRISKEDANVVRSMIEKKDFSSISEVARYAIKQFIHSYKFSKDVDKTIEGGTRSIIEGTIQPSRSNDISNITIIRERKIKHEETDKWMYFQSVYPKKQLSLQIDKLLEILER